MTGHHIPDAGIQQYVLDKPGCPPAVIEHIAVCEECKTKAANYQLLFFEIKQQPAPAFDFDLPALVMAQLKPKPAFSWASFFVYLIAAVGIISIGVVGYLSGKNLGLFTGLSIITIGLLAITALPVLIFQSIEIYNKYQRKIDALNLL